jgi:hypothetical protein
MSSPADPFDPYHEWLGIEPRYQPVDHYRLLGLARLESDLGRIATAADERMALVRSFQVGPRGRFTQTLLNELAAAKVCLLNPAAKAAYDAVLSQAMSAALAARLADPAAPPVQAASQHRILDDPREHSPATLWAQAILTIVGVALLALAAALIWGIARHRLSAVSEAPLPVEPAAPDVPSPPPVVQLQEGSGEITLAAATAELAGGVELRHVGAEEALCNWIAPDAQAAWRFRLIEPGTFRMELHYAAEIESPESVEVTVGEQRATCELLPSGGLNQLRGDSFPIAVAAAGEHALVVRPTGQAEADWLALVSVRLVPVRMDAPSPEPLD